MPDQPQHLPIKNHGEPAAPEWVARLSHFLMGEQSVEAILLDPTSHKVSLATLGQVDEKALQEKLDAVLRLLDESNIGGGAAQRATGGVTIKRLPHEETLLEKPSCPTAPMFWKWRDFSWPEPAAIEAQSREEWQTMAIQAAICGVALAAAWLTAAFTPAPPWLATALYAVSLIAGGWDAAQDVWEKLRERQLDIHFLMIAVAAGAVAIGAWTEGALLLFLFSLSGALEHYALHRTHREINALTKAAPKMANVILPDGRTESRAVERLEPGDRLDIKPDEIIPADCEVEDGETEADESNLTGESVPVPKGKGDQLFSGTLNLWGAVKAKVVRPAAESSLQRIINLIQNAQHLRAPSQRFTDKFGTRYTYLILAATAAMFFVWWLGFGIHPFHNNGESGEYSAFYRAMTLLVVASPCALVLSIPSAILAAIAWGARKGVLFRGGAAIEKLAEVDAVALDKTGTLTTGELAVHAIESFPHGREGDVGELAFTLESKSNHPLARAITAHGKREGWQVRDLKEFSSLSGKGLRGMIDGGVCYLGRRELMEAGDLGDIIKSVPEPEMSFSEVWLVYRDLIGRVLLRDQIRTESADVLRALEAEGVTTMMLTGDRRGAAERVAQELGVSEVRAGLHPEDKVAAIKEMTEAGKKIAMVGDGVNDAPSLAAAYVSIAMGGKGSDAALEQSDVVLMNDRIEKLLTARKASRRARVIIKQNLAISLGTVALMVGAAILGIVPLTLGVIAHEGSTVIVCMNSLRLLFMREEEPPRGENEHQED